MNDRSTARARTAMNELDDVRTNLAVTHAVTIGQGTGIRTVWVRDIDDAGHSLSTPL